MAPAEGRPWLPNDLDGLEDADDLDDLDDLDEDAAPRVRRFLEAITRARTSTEPPEGTSTAQDTQDLHRERTVDTERRVMRFAFACEELNVAFATIDGDDPAVRQLLADHGVGSTLAEVATKAVQLGEALESP